MILKCGLPCVSLTKSRGCNCEACVLISLHPGDSSIPKVGSRRVTLSSSPLKLFDQVTEREITLKNTGKVGFEFKVLADYQYFPVSLLPGVPRIVPMSVSRQ